MLLRDYRPQSKLVVKSSPVDKPRFPVIDAHNHLGAPIGLDWENRPFGKLLETLDEAGVVHYVDLDGGWGEDLLNSHLDAFKAKAPERFTVFGGVDWTRWAEKGNEFPEWAASRLLVQKERGAGGLKIWKPFGLTVEDHHGERVKVDDSRLDEIWQTAGELSLPVLIHAGDVVAFFDPIDETNERWEELQSHPEWAVPSPPFPPAIEIAESLANLVARHPGTTFIGAHFACYPENLGWVSHVLDRCPNFYVDISDSIAEIGRQPYSARRFFLRHADRILFGTDCGPVVDVYQIYYRFLETDDEYFNPEPAEIPRQGRWFIYGLALPDDVLAKVYFKNASRILGLE